jgi:uncharacterized protein (DUF58 family)
MLRNKLRYLLLLAAVAFLSVLYNKYYMGIIFLTVIAMPFMMFGLLSYIYGRVKAELVSVAHVVNKGEGIQISVQLSNPTIFPVSNLKIYLSYRNSYSSRKYTKEFLVSIDARTKSSVICDLFSDYAGNMEITLKTIRIYDYLKLFSLKKKLGYEVKAAVLPYYYELSEDYAFNRHTRIVESDNYSPYKSGDDPSEVFAIREYREGDRLQRIHWKLSRKLDQLMIKEFSDPMNCSVLLFVNLCVPEGENVLYYIDAILECALSISYTFLVKGRLHYFSWFDKKHGYCRRIRVSQEKDLFEAVDGLLQASPYTIESDALTAYLAEHPNDQYTDLFYITGEVSVPRLDLLSIIKAQTRQLIYINDVDNLLGDCNMPPELSERSAEMGIDLWPVDVTNVKRDMDQVRIG